MRPRRRVVVYCADPERLAVLRFVLGVRCLFAWVDDCPSMAALRRGLPGADAVVLVAAHGALREQERRELDQMFRKGLASSLNTIAFGFESHELPAAGWHIRRMPGEMAMLTETMRLATARKRGPKKRLTPEVYLPEMEERLVA